MKKTLCVIAYCITIEGLLELNAEATIVVQVRPVAETRLSPHQEHSPGPSSSDDNSYVHNSKIKLV